MGRKRISVLRISNKKASVSRGMSASGGLPMNHGLEACATFMLLGPLTVMTAVIILLASSDVAHSASVPERIAREENRTQRIGAQTQQVAHELDAIVRDLENNMLLTRDENKDFEAARTGMDEIARREVRAVLEQLLAARQALERARQQEALQQTIAAQETLIGRLTEELVRIQYRSQLRHLLEQMRTIVGNQRLAIGATQNGAIELAATNSDTLRTDILEQLTQTQDAVWHDWILVREQVKVMIQRYGVLPFIETLKQFQSKAKEMPVEPRLAETRDNVRMQRFGLAIAGQRQLAEYFLELLKILHSSGLSPAEQRSALENLIEKTEEAMRQQQDLRVQTETLGRDLTEPLRNEMARAEDQLANFVKDLAQQADQILAPETPQSQRSERPKARSEKTPEDSSLQNPKSEIRNPKSEQPGENPWAEAKAPPATTDQTSKPSSPAASDLNKAGENMINAAGQLNQVRPREASESQQAAINNLASALAHMREQMDANAQANQLDALLDSLNQQNDVLGQLGEIIRNQESLMGKTQQAAQVSSASAKSPSQAQAQGQEGQPNPAEQPAAPAQATQSPSAQPASPAELGQEQTNLGNQTQEFANQEVTAPAAEPLGKAVNEMGQAASQLAQSQPSQAVSHQGEALRSLRDAERQLAEAMAQALDAQQPLELVEQMGNLDQIIGQIEQMAGQAEAMPPAPAPQMAQQAGNIAQELGAMAAAAPAGPAMAAQMRNGSQLMGGASQQLEQGQTGQAAQTMHEAAATLTTVRGEMSAQVSAELAQALARAQAQQAAQSQQAAQGQTGQATNTPSMQAASQPSRSGRGQGMRGLGPTTYDPKKDLERELESGAWSRLPAREREQVLQALKEKYPAQYERALIRYYRNLSRLEAEK